MFGLFFEAGIGIKQANAVAANFGVDADME
jgi:hypothetical protein